MTKIFVIYDTNGNLITSYKNKNGLYTSLGTAKTAAKIMIRHRNKKLPKNERLKFEDFHVKEYGLLLQESHRI